MNAVIRSALFDYNCNVRNTTVKFNERVEVDYRKQESKGHATPTQNRKVTKLKVLIRHLSKTEDPTLA